MSFKLSASANDKDKHNTDVTALLFHEGKLFSGGNDGKIKVWSKDLKLEKEIAAHAVNVYSLAGKGNVIYSCSNDGTIKSWDISSGKCVKTLQGECPEDEVLKLFCTEHRLFSGDNKGIIKVWHYEELVGEYSLMEEITGICAKDDFLFTSGTLDVIVTEMIRGHTLQYTTRKSEPGRGPMTIVQNTVYYLDRNGREIRLLDATTGKGFNVIGTLQGHEMIVNALASSKDSRTLYSGGYDNELKAWDIEKRKNIANYKTGKCINAIAAGDSSEVYVGGVDGFIERLDVK